MLHSVSIIRWPLFIAACGCLAGCPPSRLNPVTSRIQQTRYERLVLGFREAPAAVVFLEVRDGVPPRVRQHTLESLEEMDLFDVDATLVGLATAPQVPRQELIDGIAASGMGGRLEASGMRWARPGPSRATSELGTIERQGAAIVGRADDATQVTVATLGDAILPEAELWLASPEGDVIAVELLYPGTPRVRDLRIVAVRRVDAQLALLRAEQALDRRSFGEARERLGFASQRLWKGDPLLGRVAFTEARVAAREGDVAACVAELAKATRLDSRYRDQAVRHDDFDGVRKDPRFIDFLTLAPP